MSELNQVDKVLYHLGYFDADELKKAEIAGYIEEAQQFMRDSGVPEKKLTSPTAYAVISIWADYRDKGDENNLVKKEGMIVSLISQLKRNTK